MNLHDLYEMRDRRDAYQRDHDNSVSGMGKRDSYAYSQDGGANDESPELDPTEWYIVKDGKMFKATVYPNQVQSAMSQGYSPSKEQAKAKADQSGVAEAAVPGVPGVPAAPGIPGVAKAAPGVASVKKGGTLPMTKKVLTPDQIKQYNAKQAAARQATAAPAPVPQAAAPTAPTAPAAPKAPWDPATGQGAKYDGVTGEPTPAWQKELERQEASRLEKQEADYQANLIASQAKAKEDDAYMARLNQQGARQNPSNVTNNVTQTTTAPGNVKIANGDPTQVKTAMQAKIAAMQAKNPKLAAAMQAEIDALGESVAEGSETPEKEIERLKLRQNAEHGGASLKRQAETQARIRELEKAQKNQGVAEGKADYNFDIEDLKRLETIRDLSTLKTQALALISKPSAKPMKPEKVEWFKNALERMNSPLKVIKLMYDLLLSGEGNAVVGSRSSMNPNSYRQRFSEQGDVDSDGHSVDHADSGEYDYEGDQARDQMNTIVRAARRLDGMLDDNENMPEWVQMKVTLAADYLDTAADYIESNQEPELDEGWKEKLGGAALAGAMALGAGSAQARVMPGDDPNINRLTGKPIATQQATDVAPAKAEAPKGFSKEYLQKAANPDRFGRYMISVEKAQELLKQTNEGDKIGNMDADKFDAAMARLKQLAGAGPMKTVYDPTKRVYRNVPTAVQPRK
jgi:hypothetical protein